MSRKMSWRGQPRRVSVLAEMALRREKIAQRLAELREAHSLTQEQAAAKVGVTLRQWQRWEAGESVPYPRNLDALASNFGLSVAEFFDHDLPPSGDRMTLLEAQIDELVDQLTELRAGVAALVADSLQHTKELRALRDRRHRREPEEEES